MFKLPLSDSDRAALRRHAVQVGKSPIGDDQYLLDIWSGKSSKSADLSEIRDELFAEARRVAEIAAAAAAAKHQTVRIEIKSGAEINVLPDQYRHPVFETVLRCLAARENVYLVGPAGSGKTTIASQAAKALGLPFYSTGAVGMAFQLLGFINAEGRYMETDLYRAYTQGGVFLFDEIDGSSSNAMLAFNAISANDEASFPNGTVKRHPDFVIIAAANTFGSGATAEYVGRNQLDAATLDRFAFLPMDYDERLELAISGNDEWTRHVQAFRRKVREHKVRHVVSPRASIKGAKLLAAGIDWAQVEEMLLLRGLNATDREKLAIKRAA